MKARIEFRLQMPFVGAYWETVTETHAEQCDAFGGVVIVDTPRLDVWICLIPCFPLHLLFRGKENRMDPIDHVEAQFNLSQGWEDQSDPPVTDLGRIIPVNPTI